MRYDGVGWGRIESVGLGQGAVGWEGMGWDGMGWVEMGGDAIPYHPSRAQASLTSTPSLSFELRSLPLCSGLI